ncbi:portal protein [Arthrobacter sp. Hiyo8]|nr:portal protein [Arthrobacter sp. Hiyo8]
MEIMELLDGPNVVHTGEQMRQLHFTYMNIVGESYIFMRDINGEEFIPAKGRLPAALDIFPAHLASSGWGDVHQEHRLDWWQDVSSHRLYPRPQP